jgi:hypothetical protein
MAIVASVIAGFAKDRIQSWIGLLSTHPGQRRIEQLERQQRVVTALAENEGFLVLATIRAVGGTVVTMFVLTLFVLSPMLAVVASAWCLPADPACKMSAPAATYILSSLFES